MKGGEEILHIDNICKNFDLGRGKVLKACDCVDIIVHKAETVGIVGESGSGKSTVAKMLTRLYDISAGKIIFHGEDITRLRGKHSGSIVRKYKWFSRILLPRSIRKCVSAILYANR